ncbi:hypothetical protein Xen7305DRAFT_00027870 [Xenococcus sp. PCC 7305]|uniref:hypothetical protein n=1 Tax=Xenococcus sp. PCC 7305 TaxID=102125 RepID=UPI0002ACAC26|nr:hypothetical protein [Xenococcus sp. PCC 7305]ELS03068.1 hypothetical protein Xen7305DRAFT_00027870 [Xenococcus sp. PCC 7305]
MKIREKLFQDTSSRAWRFWFIVTLVFALSYSILALKKAFQGEWVVQDDARQHVFWMMRYVNPNLFPNDLIADYFQSVAPFGYSSLYRGAVALGFDPLVFNKLLPPIIGIVTTCYCFLLSKEILPIPFGCFATSLMLNQTLWMKDDIISGTPRAFVYPFFLAFLYYFAKRSLVPCCLMIAFLGIFYPQYVFVASGLLILQLVKWQGFKPYLSKESKDYYFCFIGLGVAFFVLLPYVLNASEYGPTITRAEALELPDFSPKGRSKFFRLHWWSYIIGGGRAGLIPRSLYTPATLVFGFFLPWLLGATRSFPLSKSVRPQVIILPQLMMVSVGLFIVAHAVLFKLHLPSRYSGHSLRIVITLAAGIAVTVILEALITQLELRLPNNKISLVRKFLTLGLALAIAISLVCYPSFVKRFPSTKYKVGTEPELYQFFQQQPVDILIASLAMETDNIPTFSQRSVLVSREYAIPYHMGYYRPYRQRVIDLIEAQFSPDIDVVTQFINKYGVTHWLVEDAGFAADYVAKNRWRRQHQKITQEVVTNLEQGAIPALVAYKNSCAVFKHAQYTVISTECILRN